MYYAYVLQSLKDGEFYTGFTNNLERRIAEHNSKGQFSTKCRVPFRLVYYEGCLSKEDAIAREEYLKSGRGKKYIRNRIKNCLSESMPQVSGACPVPNF
ncbi:MAG: GIY-YIG nuclease family protein [Candidatus Omnitrophica bacterium]|nr:GIY-YIG nuclease family protein [Candidatus Omnitrophota bacterium]